MTKIERIKQLLTIARQNDLEKRDILFQFEYDELAVIYNGIGPDRFPEKLRKFVTEVNEIFEPAALIHDVEYHIGGTEKDFTEANLRFRRNCDTIVDNAYEWYDPRRYYWEFKAWRFSRYCERFGWSNYKKTEEKQKEGNAK